MARLLRSRHYAGAQPRLTQRIVELGILAILLHDTGYLKKRNDTDGTGAKYTVVHVTRSAEFAAQLLAEKGFPEAEIRAGRTVGAVLRPGHKRFYPYGEAACHLVGAQKADT